MSSEKTRASAVQSRTRQIRVVTMESKQGWIAVCLEHCLMAQAKTHGELLDELRAVVIAHAREARKLGLEPIACMDPAPDKYQQMWDPKRPVETVLLIHLPEEVDPSVPRVELTELRARAS